MRQRATECGQRGGDGVADAEVRGDRRGPSAGWNTALVIASDRPMRNASVTPTPALATITTAAIGATAASALKMIAPDSSIRHMRRMPYRSPSAACAEHGGRHGQGGETGDEGGGGSRETYRR